jgi:hypothetical protein
MALSVTLTTYSDADFIRRFVYKANDVAVDLTGSVLRMDVRSNVASHTAQISLSSDAAYSNEFGGIRILDAAAGDFMIHLPITELRNMPAGDYVHSLIRQRPDQIFDPIWEGTLVHNLGPTRSQWPMT